MKDKEIGRDGIDFRINWIQHTRMRSSMGVRKLKCSGYRKLKCSGYECDPEKEV